MIITNTIEVMTQAVETGLRVAVSAANDQLGNSSNLGTYTGTFRIVKWQANHLCG